TTKSELDFTRKQISAIVNADRVPDSFQESFRMYLFNEGHTISPNVHGTIHVIRLELPSFKTTPIVSYPFEIQQFKPGPWSKDIPYRQTFPMRFDPNGDTVMVKGSLNYGSGFGDRFDVPLCYIYVGKGMVLLRPTQGEGATPIGPGFVGC